MLNTQEILKETSFQRIILLCWLILLPRIQPASKEMQKRSRHTMWCWVLSNLTKKLEAYIHHQNYQRIVPLSPNFHPFPLPTIVNHWPLQPFSFHLFSKYHINGILWHIIFLVCLLSFSKYFQVSTMLLVGDLFLFVAK